MKFHKRALSIGGTILLSLIIIIFIYIISINPGSIKLIKRIITTPVNLAQQDRKSNRLVKVYTTHRRCGHQDLKVYSRLNKRLLREVISISTKHYASRDHRPVYRITKRDWCNSCRNNRFLGIDGLRVVVRRGTPLKPGPVTETLSIIINHLPDSERNDLMHGIPFSDDKKKLEIIEGLSEMIRQ